MRVLTLFLIWLLVGNQSLLAQTEFNEVYLKKLDNWQKSMTRWKLRNFVPLVGLHLLQEGENSFGSSNDNSIVIDSRHAPEFIGVIIKKGKEIYFKPQEGVEATLQGKIIEDEYQYTFDADRNSEKLRHNFLYWYVQYVEDDFFLRVIDDQNPLVSSFEPYDYFEGNPEFIFQGKYSRFKSPKEIALNNVIATSQRHEFTGEVSFRYKGKKYSLLVIQNSFLMFTDETNGDTSFPYGRYLRLQIMDDNTVEIDFNYSFSPPRSVSLYTTCEIPPKENHLPFKVEAGEMYENDGRKIIRPVH